MSKKNRTQSLFVRYEAAIAEGNDIEPGHHLLGGIRPMAMVAQESVAADPHCFQPPLECLGGDQHAQQWWRVDGPVTPPVASASGALVVHWTQTDDYLFATVSLADDALEVQSFQAYQALLNVLKVQGKPHLLRIWNFVPRINAMDGDTERYQLFNSGRRRAFRESGYTLADGAPAACALGTQTGGLGVAVLAGTAPATAIENPRQVSSYHYPKQYGVDAPIFSRAAWLPQAAGQDLLLLSGTASIVGHETRHAGDTLAQAEESVRNIEAVLLNANQRAGAPRWTLSGLTGRVYIRHAQDYPLVSGYLRARGMTQFSFFLADICREDLLVEIEAEGQSAHAS